VPDEGPVTARAAQQAHATGKLNPLVDPQGFGVIRRSLRRLEQQDNKFWLLTVGTPMPIESRLDTTGSMADNVDIAFRVLPNAFEQCAEVLPGYDLQVATGIFGDVVDHFVLCRPQFEMEADKIVQQLTLMVPEGHGGDAPEDPHYGLFGAAYLTATYIQEIGLKGYDFTIGDETAHDRLDESQLIRIFGPEVFDKLAENGQQINRRELPTNREIVQDLLKRAHAFFLQVGNQGETTRYWTEVFGPGRVVKLPATELVPQVQATIIGLTEGTLDLEGVPAFLKHANVDATVAKLIARSVANIPIGAQAALPNFSKRPQKGDLFEKKADLWPVEAGDKPAKSDKAGKKKDGLEWL
jgi:hypothetical protein